MPYVPLLVKKLMSAIIRSHIITISQDVVEKEQLASSEVSVAPLKDLVDFEEGMELKLARGVLEPCHFEKMKVSSAMHAFSKSTSAALSHFKLEEYAKAISFLRDLIHLLRGLKIGPQGSWTPVETGLVMATTTILEVQQGTHLMDFLDTQNSSCSASEVVRVEQLVDPSPPDMTKTESCVLYHLAGYIVKRVISFSLCEECKCALVEKVTNTAKREAAVPFSDE
ncbi:unnamed protein product [Boreogadus saida]